jgi:type II secretory pathway pseudopilin PulG
MNSIARSGVDQNGAFARLARASEGFTVIELLLVIALLVTLAAIAWPRLTQARLSANEAATIAAMRTVVEAQATFAASCGAGGYAPRLEDLGYQMPGQPGFIPQDLTGGTKSGYAFTLSPRADANVIGEVAPSCGTASVETVDAYHLTAVPISTGSGRRSFATDHRGTIYQSLAGEAIPNPIPSEVEPVG